MTLTGSVPRLTTAAPGQAATRDAEADLARTARRHGPGLMADGLRNIQEGNTTTEDVARVFQET